MKEIIDIIEKSNIGKVEKNAKLSKYTTYKTGGIAKAIVAYRNRLGGFYDLKQLREISYVTSDLCKWFKLENVAVQKININDVSLEELRKHPYLNFYQARIIVDFRRKKGPIKSLSQLALYEEFTEKDLERLSFYLSFD